MIKKLLLFDFETTGKDNPRAVQLAYKRFDVKTMKEEGKKSLLFKPPVPIEIGAMAVHHITEDAVKDAPAFDTVRDPVQSLVNTHCLVAHNAKFDIGVLKNEGIDVSKAVHICTYKLAVHLFPDFENHQLQYLRYALGVDKEEFHRIQAHDARSDVLVLEVVFNALMWKMLEEKIPEKEVDEQSIPKVLAMMADMSAKPILYPKIKFGKYKGKTFDELRLRDKGYLEWLLESEGKKPLCDQDENLTYTIKHYLR